MTLGAITRKRARTENVGYFEIPSVPYNTRSHHLNQHTEEFAAYINLPNDAKKQYFVYITARGAIKHFIHKEKCVSYKIKAPIINDIAGGMLFDENASGPRDKALSIFNACANV